MLKKLKVFHGLRNYGTQAGLLAKGLREIGVDAKAYTNADLFYRQTDYHFKPRESLIGKIFFYKIWYPLVKISCFFKYNTFHFYYGNSLLKNQKDLPFYKIFGKKVIMEYLGGDIIRYKVLIERYNLSEDHKYYNIADIHDEKVEKRFNYEKKYIDRQLVCLPKFKEFAKEAEILHLAIDLDELPYTPKEINDSIRIMHAPTDKAFKGTKHINRAIEELKNEGFDIVYDQVEGVTHEELIERYKKCDIFIDQISIGWYGTAALESMAIGRPTCAFIDPFYFQYIDYSDEIPVVSVSRENVTSQLRSLLNDKKRLEKLSIKSRRFVEKHHEVGNVAGKLLGIYKALWK